MTSPDNATTDEPDPLEAAFRTFESANVDVDDVASEAKALADDAVARLRASAREGSSASRQRAAERLAAHFAETGSAAVLDRIVAGALDDVGMHGEALETRRRALEIAPSWQPGIAADLLAAIARGFVSLENAEGAVPWIERAFSFDPFHVGALRTFVDALVATEDVAHAFGVADHLARFGVAAIASLAGRVRPNVVPPFAPDLARLRALSDDAFGKLVASLAFDPRPRPMRALHVHALACAMRSSFETAAMSAHAAMTAPVDDADELVATRALALACAARAPSWNASPRFSFDPKTRLGALDENTENLRVALHDLSPLVRLDAAARSDDPCATSILRAQATLERRNAIDLRPMHEVVGASASLHTKARRARRERLRIFPLEGAEHPMFDRLRDGEAIVVWAIREAPLDATSKERAHGLARDLGGAARLQGDVVEISVRDARDPRLIAGRAIDELADGSARTIVAARCVHDEASSAWRLVDDPPSRQVWYERLSEDGWHAAFDHREKAPISDPREGWSASMPAGDGHVPEVRPLRLVFPDVRVVWGLASVEHRGAPPIRLPMKVTSILARAKAATRRTPRGEAMARVIEAALAEHVDGPPLEIVDHRSNAHAIDEIVKDDHRGFAFGLHGVCGAFVQHVPGAFWFREYELLLALRDVIRREGLAPVVHWFRRDGLWVVNLWEPPK